MDNDLKALFDSPEHKAAVAQARADRSAAAKAKREADDAEKGATYDRMVAPGLKEKERATERRRILAKKKTRQRGYRKFYGRQAALRVVRWAYARRCDGVNQSAKLHPGKFRPIVPDEKDRNAWTKRVLTRMCKLIEERLGQVEDRKVVRDPPSDIARGRVERPARFWREVSRGVFADYRKTGKLPTEMSLQDRISFKLVVGK